MVDLGLIGSDVVTLSVVVVEEGVTHLRVVVEMVVVGVVVPADVEDVTGVLEVDETQPVPEAVVVNVLTVDDTVLVQAVVVVGVFLVVETVLARSVVVVGVLTVDETVLVDKEVVVVVRTVVETVLVPAVVDEDVFWVVESVVVVVDVLRVVETVVVVEDVLRVVETVLVVLAEVRGVGTGTVTAVLRHVSHVGFHVEITSVSPEVSPTPFSEKSFLKLSGKLSKVYERERKLKGDGITLFILTVVAGSSVSDCASGTLKRIRVTPKRIRKIFDKKRRKDISS